MPVRMRRFSWLQRRISGLQRGSRPEGLFTTTRTRRTREEAGSVGGRRRLGDRAEQANWGTSDDDMSDEIDLVIPLSFLSTTSLSNLSTTIPQSTRSKSSLGPPLMKIYRKSTKPSFRPCLGRRTTSSTYKFPTTSSKSIFASTVYPHRKKSDFPLPSSSPLQLTPCICRLLLRISWISCILSSIAVWRIHICWPRMRR